jgi:hypothetical protein
VLPRYWAYPRSTTGPEELLDVWARAPEVSNAHAVSERSEKRMLRVLQGSQDETALGKKGIRVGHLYLHLSTQRG